MAGARKSAASACTHMSRTLSRLSGRRRSCVGTRRLRGAHAAKNRLGEGTLEGVLFARVGVRDNVGPQCITERSTHLLGNAREQPAPALLCSLARHLGQFDRWGGLVRAQAK